MSILLISGSTRASSTNTAALRTVAQLADDAHLYEGLAGLPAFNPDDDGDIVPEPVAALRHAIEGSDAVLICTPEYAGSMPGSIKNLLDWLVGSTVMTDKPTAWIHVAAPGRGDGAHDQLRTVLTYIQASVVEAACIRMPVSRTDVGDDGLLSSADLRAQLAAALAAM
ncbi:NAD(P)H-dependent oxidoreductase [Antrihabitans sp. YC3-6]|uniref:NAD(P)H-dependent oxidoreductase n=1 Tax=Antrihabitans stalagmiti TaxID=2799499 RepID=A0A934NP09_9NOCA|nr:NADPH-dependent FMN reductase [Antrihabitans stalagmiti]MBJ8338665.1 NAD(P)H-dependent oxidoreductase [Antrihabitans stalagmiti]